MNSNPTAKSRILGAAVAVVERSGAAHLTIDAVAAEAKLSKGGVLYHFPNKRSMLEGMVEHVLGRLAERSARHRAQLDGPNVTIRSLILAEQDDDDEERAMSLAILAAAAEDPDLLNPAREAMADWFVAINNDTRDNSHGGQEGGGDQIGVLLLLATQGLRFLGMLNLLPMSSDERAQIRQRMLSIAQGGAP